MIPSRKRSVMREPPVRYLPGRPTVGLAATTVVTAWLVAALAFGVAVLSVRDLDPAAHEGQREQGGRIEVAGAEHGDAERHRRDQPRRHHRGRRQSHRRPTREVPDRGLSHERIEAGRASADLPHR